MMRVDKKKLDALMSPQSKTKKMPRMLRGEGITGVDGDGIMGSRKVLVAENDLYTGIENDKE